MDKGARAIMVVNTVNYYNRDNWTELPAMGYEADEGTKSQVFSISGDDGVKLWNMINPDKKLKSKEIIKKILKINWSNTIQLIWKVLIPTNRM